MNTQVQLIKKVREATGLGIAECKIALQASDWSYEGAISYAKLHIKPSTKPVGAGAVFAYVHHNHQLCAVVELHCGTDFVALSEEFHHLGNNLAKHIAAMNPLDEEDLLIQKYVLDTTKTVKELLDGVSAQVHEPIKVSRFVILEVSSGQTS